MSLFTSFDSRRTAMLGVVTVVTVVALLTLRSSHRSSSTNPRRTTFARSLATRVASD